MIVAAINCGKNPEGEVDRCNKNLQHRCPIKVPAVKQNYNAFMGGLDLCNQMLK